MSGTFRNHINARKFAGVFFIFSCLTLAGCRALSQSAIEPVTSEISIPTVSISDVDSNDADIVIPTPVLQAAVDTAEVEPTLPNTDTPTPTDTLEPTETPAPTQTPTQTSTPTETQTPTATSTPTSTATPSNTPTPSATPTATATPTPTEDPRYNVALITDDTVNLQGSTAYQVDALLAETYDNTQSTYARAPANDVADLVTETDYDLIVVSGLGLEDTVETLADLDLTAQIIAIEQLSTVSAKNLIQIGGADTGYDDIAFMAGAMLGVNSRNLEIIGYFPETHPYLGFVKNGFIHGLRLTCGVCNVTTIDYSASEVEAIAAKAPQTLAEANIDGVFIVSMADIDPLLTEITDSRIDVAHYGYDSTRVVKLASRQAHLLPVAQTIAIDALAETLTQLDPDQVESKTITLSIPEQAIVIPGLEGAELTPAEIDIVMDTLARLESEMLQTGVDPITGEKE